MNDHYIGSDRIKITFRNPPEEHRFRPNQSGNPTGGGRRQRPSDLFDEIRIALNEPLPRVAGQRSRMTRRELGVRRLIYKAGEGDVTAFTDLVKLRKEAGHSRSPRIVKVGYEEALNMKKYGARKLTNEFFQEQDRQKAERRRLLKQNGLPMADLIDRELGRRVKAAQAGRTVRVSMRQVIANRFSNEVGEGNGKVIRLLQMLMPEKKTFSRPTVTEVERPKAEK